MNRYQLWRVLAPVLAAALVMGTTTVIITCWG